MLTVTMMSITCGYHRLFAHQAYKAAPWLENLFLFFAAATFQESCLKWAADHRTHHQFVDEDKDPYSIKRGFWWAHMGWILTKQTQTTPFPKDLTDNPRVAFQYKYWIYIAVFMSFILPMLIGLAFGNPIGGLVFGGFLRLFVSHHFTFSINSFAHTLGTQPYTDQNSAKDSWITALITFGEGYHNFHHWYSRDYRNGIRFFHWDPGKWFIKACAFFGQTWDLKKVSENVVLKAKLEMQKKKIEPFLSDATQEKINDLYIELQKKVDAFVQQKNEWKKAANKHSQTFKDNLTELHQSFETSKAEYKQALDQWKRSIRSVRSHPQRF